MPAPPASPPKRKKSTRILGILLFVVLNAVVLWLTARADLARADESAAALTLQPNAVWYLLCALFCAAAALFAESAKYVLMMRRLGERVSPAAAFTTAALGKYYDAVTPSGAGGQPFQIWHLHSLGYSDRAAGAMPLCGFLTMQYGFILLALIVFPRSFFLEAAAGMKALAFVGLIAYAIVPTLILLSARRPAGAKRLIGAVIRFGAKLRLVRNPEQRQARAEEALQRYHEGMALLIANRRLLALLLALSVLYHGALCSIPYFVLRGFGGSLGFFDSLCLCVLVYASVTLVPTPGNAGAAEGSFYLLFSQLEAAGLFWAMLSWRFLSYYLFILLGLGIYGFRFVKAHLRRKDLS